MVVLAFLCVGRIKDVRPKILAQELENEITLVQK